MYRLTVEYCTSSLAPDLVFTDSTVGRRKIVRKRRFPLLERPFTKCCMASGFSELSRIVRSCEAFHSSEGRFASNVSSADSDLNSQPS